jgi:hypothetical protein
MVELLPTHLLLLNILVVSVSTDSQYIKICCVEDTYVMYLSSYSRKSDLSGICFLMQHLSVFQKNQALELQIFFVIKKYSVSYLPMRVRSQLSSQYSVLPVN